VGQHLPVLDLDQRLRAGADDVQRDAVRGLAPEQVHVRAGVRRAQAAVDVERVGRAVQVEALGEHHLEDLAVPDRLQAKADGVQVVLPWRAGAGLRGVHDVVDSDRRLGGHAHL